VISSESNVDMQTKGFLLTCLRFDYLINVFGLSTKEAQRLLKDA
jgi:hypothetical protein